MTDSILVRQQTVKAKTYGNPRDLSLKAMGLLYHILLHLNSDGSYSWGNVNTADHFGVHYNRIAEGLHELISKGYIIDIQSGKDPQTGKNRLQIVRPTARALKPHTPVCAATETPHALVRVELNNGNAKSSLHGFTQLVSVSKSTHTSERLNVIGNSTVNESVSTGCNGAVNVNDTHTHVRGLEKLQAELQEARDELATWERYGKTKNAEACRLRIAELETQIGAQR